MSAGEETPNHLVRSKSAALSQSEAKTLVARGVADLRKKEHAEELLRKGLQLQQNAFSDPEWRAVCDSQPNSQREFWGRVVRAPEYIRRVLAGEDLDSTAGALGMTPEDQEMANTLHTFFPSSVLSLAEMAEKKIETQLAVIAEHEELLKEAFRCFEMGLELDPDNLDLICSLADCYSAGQGVEQDEGKELALLRKAVEMGDISAQTALAYHYSNRSMDGPEKEQAIYWFRKAADQGDEIAIRALKRLSRTS